MLGCYAMLTHGTKRNMFIRTMNNRRPPTLLELALMGLIQAEQQSGYDLRKKFATTPIGHFSGSPGAVYPALKRLKARGLVETSADTTHPLRPRELFRLTPAGAKLLAEWATRLPTREEVIFSPDELMLRFAFMPGLCSTSHTVRFLDILAEESDGYADELERVAEEIADQSAPHPSLAVRHGVETYRATARWARHAAGVFG